MEAWLSPYSSSVLALGAMAGLSLVQLAVVDVVGVRARHTPGTPVTADHGDLLFRATRAHANTNESIAVFILVVLFGILSGASPVGLARLAWLYVGARAGHMLCYYANLQIPRSLCFGVAMLALIGLLVVGIATWV